MLAEHDELSETSSCGPRAGSVHIYLQAWRAKTLHRFCFSTASAAWSYPLYASMKPVPGEYGTFTDGGKPSVINVDYCIAEKTMPACTIRMSRSILIAVILANVAKLACFVVILTWAPEAPLVTVRDAIASLLSRPEPGTKGIGALSVMDIHRSSWICDANTLRPFALEWRFWFRAGSPLRWRFASTLSVIALHIRIGDEPLR